MIKKDIFNKIVAIVNSNLNVQEEEIDYESTFDNLGANSLTKLFIIMDVESEFDIFFCDDEINKINTINDLITIMLKYCI